MKEEIVLSCILCNKTEDETNLIDIELNSLKFEDEIIEYSELLLEVLNLKANFSFSILILKFMRKNLFCRLTLVTSALNVKIKQFKAKPSENLLN